MSYGGGYGPGGYAPVGYGPSGYSPGGYSPPGGYAPGGYDSGYSASPSAYNSAGYANPDGVTDPADTGGPKGGGPSSQPLDTHISSFTGSDGRAVTVNFVGVTSDGLNGDQAVTAGLASTTAEVMDSAGFNSYNVSATTNGHAGETGDHSYGDAVDINWIGGVHVSASGQGYDNAVQLEEAAMTTSTVRYVEGPMGDFARSSPTGDWVRTANLPNMNSHVHISIFPE